jgi:hypothetical protein
MTRSVTFAVLASLISSVALAQTPAKHLLVYKSKQDAQRHCGQDTVVWASTSSHRLYLPGDKHYGRTRGGYVCESEARKLGYRGPTAHT